jgi:hypothetical protein
MALLEINLKRVLISSKRTPTSNIVMKTLLLAFGVTRQSVWFSCLCKKCYIMSKSSSIS